eukprot:2180151-Amphidinium_carterae.1
MLGCSWEVRLAIMSAYAYGRKQDTSHVNKFTNVLWQEKGKLLGWNRQTAAKTPSPMKARDESNAAAGVLAFMQAWGGFSDCEWRVQHEWIMNLPELARQLRDQAPVVRQRSVQRCQPTPKGATGCRIIGATLVARGEGATAAYQGGFVTALTDWRDEEGTPCTL